MNTKEKVFGYTMVLLSTILWGTSFVWSKVLIKANFPVFTIVTIRIVIAAISLMLIFYPRGKIEKIHTKDLKWFVLLCLMEPFFYFIGENFGLKYVSASFASIMIALIPIFVTFSMHFIYGDRLKSELIIGIIASVAGVFILSSASSQGEIQIKGVLLLFLAIFAAVGYSVILSKLIKQGYGPISITTWQNVMAIVFYVPCFLFFDLDKVGSLAWNFENIFALCFLGVLCSAGAYMFYSISVKYLTINKTTVFSNLIPVVTIVFAAMIGQEDFTIMKIFGALLAIAGVVLSQSNVFDVIRKKCK